MTRIFILILCVYSLSGMSSTSVISEGVIFSSQFTKYHTEAFLSLPYAEAPVGDLRWKAPRKKRLARRYKSHSLPPACAQVASMFANVSPSEFGQPVGSEDCLYLNIWRPRKKSHKKRPVFFWIHGGSNTKGTSSDPNYGGAFFANQNDAIFVSVNYRLGLFASFVHSSLESGDALDDSGNFVTLDLIMALKWVKTHIDKFGGDPHNIIIAGQSAGCMNVWGLLHSPLAKDLFNGAICSAGLPNAYPKLVVRERSESLLYDLLIADGFAKDTSSAKRFLKNQSKREIKKYLLSKTSAELLNIPRFVVPTQHISDGIVLPLEGIPGILLGRYNKVPLILGATVDEGTYLVGAGMLAPTESELFRMMNDGQQYEKEDLIKSAYLSKFGSITSAGSKTLSLALEGVAQGLRPFNDNIYKYEFSWKDMPDPWKDVFGSFHGLDAIFYLGNFVEDRPSFGKFAWSLNNVNSREVLREKMSSYIKSFLHYGNPNTGHNLDEWHSFSKTSHKMKFE